MLFQAQIDQIKAMLPISRHHRIKQNMRQILLQKRRIMRPKEVEEGSKAIIEKLTQLPEWQNAKTVLCYYPIQNEVNIRPLLEEYKDSKLLLLPATTGRRKMEMRPYKGHDNLLRGRLNIPTPESQPYQGHVDLIIVPGVAFDKEGRRLGRGGGYYDKFLRSHPTAAKIGVAYDYQLVPEVPTTFLDVRVKKVITPSKIY